MCFWNEVLILCTNVPNDHTSHMSSHSNGGGETGLAVPGDLGSRRNDARHPPQLRALGFVKDLQDIFNGGTDTLSTALEWTMTELLRHPIVMKKLQKEVREIVKNKHDITDEDLGRMTYLKAVIKETLRTHPPIPLLVPRIARNDVKVKGYDISAKTMVMINAWAIGRDPASWDEPEMFKPERFLDSSIDFKGLDFELIPFGAGRRGCPGIAFADATLQFVLANIVQKFDWKLPNGVEEKDLDMSESPGVTVHRSVPLLAVASRVE